MRRQSSGRCCRPLRATRCSLWTYATRASNTCRSLAPLATHPFGSSTARPPATHCAAPRSSQTHRAAAKCRVSCWRRCSRTPHNGLLTGRRRGPRRRRRHVDCDTALRTRQRALRSQRALCRESLRTAHEPRAVRCERVGGARRVRSAVGAGGAQRGVRSARLRAALLHVRRVRRRHSSLREGVGL